MTFVPLDPTKAEVRATQVGGQLDFDFYIPRGSKGEPGGFTLGTALDNAVDSGNGRFNLDDVKTSGIYRMTATNDNLLIRNYPRNYDTGILEVFERVPGQTIIQVWHSLNINSRVTFERGYVNGWQPWRMYASTRVDQTAGRAIYQWNDTALQDQLVYGDTGLRQMALPSHVTAGNWFIRRHNYDVYIYIQFTAINNNAGQDAHTYEVLPAGSIPVGFQPPVSVPISGFGRIGAANQRQPLTAFLYSAGRIALEKDETNAGGAIINNSAASFYFGIHYTTTQAWPTVLPGSASGSIPNA